MPDQPSSTTKTPIPEELRKQLAEFQSHLWRIKVTEAVLAGIFGLVVSYLLVFLLERAFPIPATSRFVILLAGTSLSAIFAPLWIRRWVFGHKREDQIARLIAKKFPKLGDRLLGIIELQDQKETREALSPELRAAAMAHVAAQAAKRDMGDALPNSRHKKLAIAVAMGFAVIALGVSIAPKAGGNAFKRWLLPFSKTEHYTFTQFDTSKIPNPMVVPYDEPFTFSLPLSEDTDDRPAVAQAKYGDQDWITAEIGEDGVYRFTFTGQQEQNQLSFKAGDATSSIRVEPETRPVVLGFEADVRLPDYLQLDPRTVDVRTGSLTALEGSSVVFKGTFDRELTSGKARMTSLPREEEEQLLPEDDSPELIDPDTPIEEGDTLTTEAPAPLPEPRDLKMSVAGNTLTTEPITLDRFRAEIPFTWKDVKNLDGDTSFDLKIATTSDMAPFSYLQGVERNVIILAEETITFEVLNEDDFGLKSIGIEWRGEFTQPTDQEPAKGEMLLKKGIPSDTILSEEVIFSPQTHGIPPQKLLLSAYAEDYKPGRGRVYSEPIVIYILTREEHAQIVKAEFDRLINELEGVAAKEQANLDNNERLDKSNDAEELQGEETQKKLAESEKAEAENAEKMKDIAKKMEEIFKDAARNGNLDDKTMKEMADAMQNMKELGEQDMPEIEQKLNDAQNQKSTPEKTEQDLKEAIEKQKEAVKKMKETVEKANQANENFEASTFVVRLKRAASEEDGIAAAMIGAFEGSSSDEQFSLLGATPESDNMDPVHQRLLDSLINQQKRTAGDIRWIQEDLGRFYARTKKPKHKEVHQAMEGFLIDVKLEKLRRLIADNQSFNSTRMAKHMSNKLKEWAKILEDAQNDEGGGGEGGGGGSQEEKDFEFMLKVMRMVQAEQDIRGRTRSLEQLLRSMELSKDVPLPKPE
ncbi:MAG: hypothetical protein ACON5N_01850 [Akkermansiaceae bacterium]